MPIPSAVRGVRDASFPDLYSAEQVGELFGVKEQTVRLWAKRGTIPPGRRIAPRVTRWTMDDIKTLLKDRR